MAKIQEFEQFVIKYKKKLFFNNNYKLLKFIPLPI